MEFLENLLKSNFILLIYIIVNIGLIIVVCINTKRLNDIKKNYINFMKKLGDGTNIDEILKEYISKVDYVSEENKIVNSNCINIENDMKKCVQKIGLIRYNAFDDVGSELSFAVAILDDNNNGIVLNGIYAQNSSNIYAKPIEKGESKYALSIEEKKAIDQAISKK